MRIGSVPSTVVVCCSVPARTTVSELVDAVGLSRRYGVPVTWAAGIDSIAMMSDAIGASGSPESMALRPRNRGLLPARAYGSFSPDREPWVLLSMHWSCVETGLWCTGMRLLRKAFAPRAWITSSRWLEAAAGRRLLAGHAEAWCGGYGRCAVVQRGHPPSSNASCLGHRFQGWHPDPFQFSTSKSGPSKTTNRPWLGAAAWSDFWPGCNGPATHRESEWLGFPICQRC